MFGIFSGRYTTEAADVFALRSEVGLLRLRSTACVAHCVTLQRDLTFAHTQEGKLIRDVKRLEESNELAREQVKEAGMIIAAKDTIINRQDEENARLMALIKHFNIVDVEEA